MKKSFFASHQSRVRARIPACLAVGFLLVALPGRADIPVECPWFRTVETPPPTQETIVRVPLDAHVYEHTADNLGDLRLVTHDGTEIPTIIDRETTLETHVETILCPLRQTEFEKLEDNALAITFERPRDVQVPDQVHLDTPLRDFEKRVDVVGSDDGVTWTPLVTEHPCYDYSRFMDVRSTTVPFPARAFNFYQVRIHAVTDLQTSPVLAFGAALDPDGRVTQEERGTLTRREFRINSISFRRATFERQKTQDRRVVWPVESFAVTNQDDGRATEIIVAMRREPLTGLKLMIADRNVHRGVVVQVPVDRPGQPGWQTIADSAVTRLDFRGYKREDATLSFPETRQSTYRILIENGDAVPLTVTAVEGVGHAQQVWFLAYPEQGDYRLYYGAPKLASPAYGDASVLRDLRSRAQASSARLGEVQPNAAWRASFGDRGFVNNRAFVIVSFVVMVVGLGWGVYAALKRVEAAAED